MLPDGSLMIIGRTDDQIKLRGQRIELNEVNSVLGASGELLSTITMGVNLKSPSSQQLATFYVPAKQAGSSFSLLHPEKDKSRTAELFRLLKSKLPNYMVPTYLIPMSAVPLTPSGKADKSILRDKFQQLTQDQLSWASDFAEQDPEDV